MTQQQTKNITLKQACMIANIIPISNRVRYDNDGLPIQFDETDTEIVMKSMEQRERMYKQQPNIPMIGDVIQYNKDTFSRVAHVFTYDMSMQPATGRTITGGSYYLTTDGYASMSGGLDICVPIDNFKQRTKRQHAPFWIFHHNRPKAYNGVHFQIPVKIWKLRTD